MSTANASDDVMDFLDGLDDLVPVAASASATAPAPSPSPPKQPAATRAAKDKEDKDVLAFLDELDDANPKPAAPPAPTTTTQQPAQQLKPTPATPTATEETVLVQNESTAASQAWGWAGSIWSSAQATASKVSATAVSSLQMAEAMVEETLTSDKVKGMVTDVSSSVSNTVSGVVKSDTVGRLTKDISKFTMNTASAIGDVIAPPIDSPTYRGGNSTVSHMLFNNDSTSTAPPLANTITLWLCAELQDDASTTSEDGMVTQTSGDMIHDFVQSTVNSLWLHGGGLGPSGSARAIGTRIVVNSVTDPSPRPARGVQEAVKVIETTVQRLQKLALANESTDSTSDPTTSTTTPPNATLYLLIQPFTTLIPSPLPASTTQTSATVLHRHYLTMLLNPGTKLAGLDVVSAVSQSVRADKARGGVVAGSGEWKGLMEKWSEEQVMRVVEVAVNDVLEEFSLRAKGVDGL
ncbi:hypothetical protein HDU98_004953 [Podochytrium sp. JEL0797]|nr:hypothetical protein HDU98_004953 [Podochytrium sp. JEL0797]